jgi:hypothetical protein
MIINYFLFILGILFFIISILIHEFIHYLALKILGYDGKLVIVKKYISIGIKPIGFKNNIVCAREAVLVKLAPFPFTIIWCAICFTLMNPPNIHFLLNWFYAIITGVGLCIADIGSSIQIWRWWIRKKQKN